MDGIAPPTAMSVDPTSSPFLSTLFGYQAVRYRCAVNTWVCKNRVRDRYGLVRNDDHLLGGCLQLEGSVCLSNIPFLSRMRPDSDLVEGTMRSISTLRILFGTD